MQIGSERFGDARGVLSEGGKGLTAVPILAFLGAIWGLFPVNPEVTGSLLPTTGVYTAPPPKKKNTILGRYQPLRPCSRRNLKKSGEIPPPLGHPPGGGTRTFFRDSATTWSKWLVPSQDRVFQRGGCINPHSRRSDFDFFAIVDLPLGFGGQCRDIANFGT